MTEPNRENIRAWVDALRSGKYEQGYGGLRTPKGHYCCLGVACDLAVRAGVIAEPQGGSPYWRYAGTDAELPAPVARWLGIAHGQISPCVHVPTDDDDPDEIQVELAELNDSQTPFAEIADLIEAEWLTNAPSEVDHG